MSFGGRGGCVTTPNIFRNCKKVGLTVGDTARELHTVFARPCVSNVNSSSQIVKTAHPPPMESASADP